MIGEVGVFNSTYTSTALDDEHDMMESLISQKEAEEYNGIIMVMGNMTVNIIQALRIMWMFCNASGSPGATRQQQQPPQTIRHLTSHSSIPPLCYLLPQLYT